MSFETVPGDASSSYIVHVPHSSTSIPDDVRAQLLLDDDALAEELRLMTDARTDELAMLAAERVTPRPWLFVNSPTMLAASIRTSKERRGACRPRCPITRPPCHESVERPVRDRESSRLASSCPRV